MDKETRTVLVDGYRPRPPAAERGFQPQPAAPRTPPPKLPEPPKAQSVINKPR